MSLEINLIASKIRVVPIAVLSEVGINKKNNKIIIKINPKFYRPTEVDYLIGDYSKARKHLSWKPRYNFEQLVEMMVRFELENS